jgi:membrane protein
MNVRGLDDPRIRRGRAFAEAIVREVRAENVTFMAGSIAYHAFVSLVPFLLLVLFLVSEVGGQETARSLIEAMAANLTPAGQERGGAIADFTELLVSAATSGAPNAGLSALSLVALSWGTLRIFRGLDQAFSDIYESEDANSFLDQLADGVVVFVALGLALFGVSAAESFIGVPSLGVADRVVRPLLSVLAIGIAFLPMYYVFPDEGVTVREVIPGALIAGAGWTALSAAFRFYVDLSSTSSYGVVGVVILLITWLYFGGLVILVGAAFNAVLAGRSEDVQNIAWGADPGEDHTANDADFVAPLEELTTALEGEYDEIRITAGDEEITIPRPDEVTVDVDTVDRPGILGGNRETAEILLEWDSWAREGSPED